jgi:hypothetical protein
MQRPLRLAAMAALGVMILPNPAMAYIGPGMGLGAITAVLGILAALVMAVIGLVWYPMKRMFKKRSVAVTADPAGER